MTEEVLGTTIKACCGRCGGERNCEVKGFHVESGSDAEGLYTWETNWYLLVCRGCEFPFAQSVSTDSEQYLDIIDHNGDVGYEYIQTIHTWPAKSMRPRPDWFDHYHIEGNPAATALSAALNELYRALDADLLALSSIGIRTAFDVAAEALEVEPTLSFAEKLTQLVSSGKILSSQKETLEVLVEAGSASAHRGWKPDADQIHVQMEILEEFIYSSMVLPAREKSKAHRVAKLKEAVPPKSMVRKTRPPNLLLSQTPNQRERENP